MQTKRPPIVTVLGHVDHGKTTLLDTIRKSSVAAREAGGITQSIGASKVDTKRGVITIVDTPGHAVIGKMRERGARVADIALLVCAADDGVKPQTKEALTYILEAQIPYIVVFTKTDLPSANVDKAQGTLMEAGVLFEGLGGDVPSVSVSAKNGTGIDELLEMIELVAEVQDIVADAASPFAAKVIETKKDKAGCLVSVVVTNGTLKAGMKINAGGITASVRGLFGDKGSSVKEAIPGDPVQVLGFNALPEVGADVVLADVGATVTEGAASNQFLQRESGGEISIVLKSETAGSLEALVASIPAGVSIVKAEVGDVIDADVFLAKASGAMIITFESKAGSAVQKLAETESIEIKTFKIIYDLTKYLTELLEKGKEQVLGEAFILDAFPFNNKRVAGCKIMKGKLTKKDTPSLMRDGKIVGKVKILSIRKAKHEVDEVSQGEECGILFVPQLDFQKDDVLVSAK